jgi:dihydroorotase/N-acyl-D-amino-acid deacylase
MFDILIRQATIIDGTGAPPWTGDAGISNGRFEALAPRLDAGGHRTIEARGRVLAPGFIDIHCHSDISLLENPGADIKLFQGVTTEVLGNCGMSLAPLTPESRDELAGNTLISSVPWKGPVNWLSFAEYISRLEQSGLSINVAGLVGHGTLRMAVMGMADVSPDSDRMARMQRLLAESLAQGACGMSSGLIYAPGCYADTRELAELARVMRTCGGFYATHMRNEARYVLDAIEETLEIGRRAQVPVHISHLKVAGRANWHLADRVVEKIESARREGVDVTCDVYPYFCSSTTLLATLPPWCLDGGIPSLMPRLRDPRLRRRIISEIKDGLPGWENMYQNAGWEKITIASVGSDGRRYMQGRTIAALAEEKGQDPFTFVLDLIEAEQGAVAIISESMNEAVMERFLTLPFAMVGSDGDPGGGHPHPRLYGTFPRVIARFVRELGLLTLEEAIAKMTAMSADRLGLKDCGRIAAGLAADAVLFDAGTFRDRATYDAPCQYPEGLEAVLVNGRVVIDETGHTGTASGRLRRPSGNSRQ